RPDDVELLAKHFAEAAGMGALPADVLARLSAHTWPGNARELRNAVHAYAALGTLPETAQPEIDLLEGAFRRLIDAERPYQEQKEEFVFRFTKAYLELVLARAGGNQSEAARVAGM